MKALAFLLLVCVAACRAETTTTNVVGDIRTVISERTSPRISHFESSFRGKKRVMFVMGYPIGNGKTNLSYSYFADGVLMTEEDDDGDGFFEGVSVSMRNSDDMEIFTRDKDGTVKPTSTEKIRLVKEEVAVATSWDFFSAKDRSVEETGKLLREKRETIGKLQQQEIAATNASPDLTTKVEEHKDKDGIVDFRVESTYRGKNKILEVTNRRNTFGRMLVSSRSYFLGGKSIAIELVSPADGKFLSLTVRSPDKSDTEIFKRNSDGVVTPASAAEIKSFKGIP